MGLRRMLVKMLDPAGNADGTKFVGIDGGKAAWVDPPSGGITGLTSDDSSVTITDNGDGTLDLAATGGGGGGGGWGAWTALAAAGVSYGTSVGEFGGAYGACQIRKSTDGDTVQLRGLLQASAGISAGSTVLTLPTGYRPPRRCVYLSAVATGNFLRIDVTSTGTVLNVGALSSAQTFSLDLIEFSTAS